MATNNDETTYTSFDHLESNPFADVIIDTNNNNNMVTTTIIIIIKQIT